MFTTLYTDAHLQVSADSLLTTLVERVTGPSRAEHVSLEPGGWGSLVRELLTPCLFTVPSIFQLFSLIIQSLHTPT